jgi:hypothetical protein
MTKNGRVTIPGSTVVQLQRNHHLRHPCPHTDPMKSIDYPGSSGLLDCRSDRPNVFVASLTTMKGLVHPTRVPVVALAFVQNPMHRSLAALDVAPPEDFSAGPGPYSDF